MGKEKKNVEEVGRSGSESFLGERIGKKERKRVVLSYDELVTLRHVP